MDSPDNIIKVNKLVYRKISKDVLKNIELKLAGVEHNHINHNRKTIKIVIYILNVHFFYDMVFGCSRDNCVTLSLFSFVM